MPRKAARTERVSGDMLYLSPVRLWTVAPTTCIKKPMPLYWTIDSKQRLFTGIAEGDVSFANAIALLEAMAGANALSYRKLFDGRAAISTMSIDELLSVCVKIRGYHSRGAM